MTILPLPLPQSAVPPLSPTSAAALRFICAAVSRSAGAALLSWLPQAGDLGRMLNFMISGTHCRYC